MDSDQEYLPRLRPVERIWQLRLLVAVSLLWMAPALACGSFAPRATPTVTPVPLESTNGDVATPLPTSTPALVVIVPVLEQPTPTPPSAPAVAALPAGVLAPGQPAQVTAPAGLNMRQQPASDAQRVAQLTTGQRVTVVEGPANAAGRTWWRVDDGQGNSGWVAERDNETVWLSPIGGTGGVADPTPTTNPSARPVDREPRTGDRVEVTMPVANGQLSIRSAPTTAGNVTTRVNSGTRLIIESGPQIANGYNWYLVRSDDNTIRGWAAGGDGKTRWLSPLE